MKSAARMAVVAGAAYPLGRYHKLRWALALAAVGATGRLESPGQLALRGVKVLASSPEVSELTEEVRGRLLDAARAAAISAATSSIGSLTGRLNDQTEALRGAGGEVAKGVTKATGPSSTEDEDDEADEAEEAGDDGSSDDEQRQRESLSEGRRPPRDRQDDGAGRRRRQSRRSDDGEGETRSPRRAARSEGNGGGSPVRRKG